MPRFYMQEKIDDNARPADNKKLACYKLSLCYISNDLLDSRRPGAGTVPCPGELRTSKCEQHSLDEAHLFLYISNNNVYH